MLTEKELLDRLIRDNLGEGKAEFEVNVGGMGKSIDLVFQKKDEIWLIEAKKKLNYEALGQVITYKTLYLHKVPPSKEVKLGIVCEGGDSEIEAACKSKGVQVFILTQGKEQEIEKAPICGICGDQMVEENDEFKCKTCAYFFGMSSRIQQCIGCKGKYGAYPAIETSVLSNKGNYFRKNYWKERLCPECRKQELPEWANWNTLADLIREDLNRRETTVHQLEMVAGLPKEFIDYCLGKMKPYL